MVNKLRTVYLQVNAQVFGKAPIHCAAAAGRVSVLKMLLEFQANLEIEVSYMILLRLQSSLYVSTL